MAVADPTSPPRLPVANVLTVDVEDWVQSVYDHDLPLTDHFIRNTHRVLALFDRYAVRATFFVLGLAARKAPELVRTIDEAGHEVQSHGYGHRRLDTLSRNQVTEDADRSKKLLEDMTGKPVTAFRAPAFSITRANPDALDVLLACGYTIDSSIVPARTRRYGIAGMPHHPHRLRTPGGGTIVEVPVATAKIFGRRVPMGGGGYLRLYPAALVARAVRAINRAGHPATLYMHPYELNPGELSALPCSIPWKMRLHQGLGRRRFAVKLERLLATLRFGRLRDVPGLEALPVHDPDWAIRPLNRAAVPVAPPPRVSSAEQTAATEAN